MTPRLNAPSPAYALLDDPRIAEVGAVCSADHRRETPELVGDLILVYEEAFRIADAWTEAD